MSEIQSPRIVPTKSEHLGLVLFKLDSKARGVEDKLGLSPVAAPIRSPEESELRFRFKEFPRAN
jgi:hypothetical protein